MSGHTPGKLLSDPIARRYPFIKKPFTHRELASRVREVLDS